MKINKSKLFFILLLICIINSCGGSKEESNNSSGSSKSPGPNEYAKYEELPLITSFSTAPTDVFLLDSTGLNKVSRTSPFFGASTKCSREGTELKGHTGGHVHFENDSAPYEVNIYAVADGIIDEADTCYPSITDRMGVDLAIGKNSDGSPVIFHYSIEPLENGHGPQQPCSGDGGDPDYFSEYMLVSTGDKVSKGDLIAKFPKFASQTDDGAHIHFNLRTDSQQRCPNIFDSDIKTSFAKANKQGDGLECDGTIIAPTFCYLPDPEEDIVSDN